MTHPDLTSALESVVKAWEPLDVAKRRNVLLLDVRPLAERHGDLGWLPASQHIPTESVASTAAWLQGVAHSEPVIVYCSSGRRSEQYASHLRHDFAGPVANLSGGVLGWTAVGLPTCGTSKRPLPNYLDSVRDVEGFQSALRSCFVAEMMEQSAQSGVEFDVMALLQTCFEEEPVDWSVPVPDLHRLIDRIALASRRVGTDWGTIAANTDMMVSALARFFN